MIRFNLEDVSLTIKNKMVLKKWLASVAEDYGFKINQLNYIFCSDDYLLKMNQTYLSHETFTDIITFDLSEFENEIEGDIFISLERVQENSLKFNTKETELFRVMAHGLLHLIGFKDKTEKDKEIMRDKENLAILKLRI